jgi:hypothetical protein
MKTNTLTPKGIHNMDANWHAFMEGSMSAASGETITSSKTKMN